MKKRKYYFYLFGIILLFFVLLFIQNTLNKNSKNTSLSPVLYLGTSNFTENLSAFQSLKIEHSELISEDYFGEYQNIITDQKNLETNKEFFIKAVENGCRLLILDAVSCAELRKLFGFADQKIPSISQERTVKIQDKKNTMDDTIMLLNFGTLVYKKDSEEITANILIQTMDSEKIFKKTLIEKALFYCFTHDYTQQAKKTEESWGNNTSLFSWIEQGSHTETYVLEYFIANILSSLSTYEYNPNSYGQYLFFIPCTLEIDLTDRWAVQYTEIKLSNDKSATIYNWSSKSWGTTKKIKALKILDETDNNNLDVRYQPENILKIPIYERHFLGIGLSIISYKNDNPSQHAYGNFSVKLKKVNWLGLTTWKEITYTISFPIYL